MNPFVRLPLCPLHRYRDRHRSRAACRCRRRDRVSRSPPPRSSPPSLPNVTVAPAAKFVPVIVTAVPPPSAPLFGDHTAHRRRDHVREPARQTSALRRPTRHRHRHRSRTACRCRRRDLSSLLTTTTFVAAVAPNVTVAPAAKFVPVIVTAVPPAVVPRLGLTLLTVGRLRR